MTTEAKIRALEDIIFQLRIVMTSASKKLSSSEDCSKVPEQLREASEKAGKDVIAARAIGHVPENFVEDSLPRSVDGFQFKVLQGAACRYCFATGGRHDRMCLFWQPYKSQHPNTIG